MRSKSLVLKRVVVVILAVLVAGVVLAHAAEPNAEQIFRETMPGMQFSKIQPSEIPGIYEVYVGDNILYFHPETKMLVIGDMITPQGKYITAEKRQALAAERIKSLDTAVAVKIGNGKTKVIEFTDPDCPYCRRASEWFANRDVTRYVFFMPLPMHPDAPAKAKFILGATDKEIAYKEVFSGKYDGTKVPSAGTNVENIYEEHVKTGKQMGVQATPMFFINGTKIAGADFKKLEAALAQ